MTTTATPTADSIIGELTEEDFHTIAQAVEKLTESKLTKVKRFVTAHKTIITIAAVGALSGVVTAIAVTHKDELHDVIDALPEAE